jgi:TRAP-type mannitol/chloroaromatic compound transport system permease small subunit
VGSRRPTRSVADSTEMTAFLFFIDYLSTWVGRVFAWLILVLTIAMS